MLSGQWTRCRALQAERLCLQSGACTCTSLALAPRRAPARERDSWRAGARRTARPGADRHAARRHEPRPHVPRTPKTRTPRVSAIAVRLFSFMSTAEEPETVRQEQDGARLQVRVPSSALSSAYVLRVCDSALGSASLPTATPTGRGPALGGPGTDRFLQNTCFGTLYAFV